MKPFFVDTNIPVYAAGKEHKNKVPCSEIIIRIADGRIRAVSSVEVLQEILHIYSQTKEQGKGIKIFQDFRSILEHIFPITIKEINLAGELLEKHKDISARDALHASVMILNGIAEICSTDGDFDKIEGIKRIDPAELIKLV
jgi:predicted nucleic acid-binding protein